MVLDHVPDEDEIADYAAAHLEDFPADEAYARCSVVYKAPDFLEVGERDQINAHMRDGAACVLVIYMCEGDGVAEGEDPLDTE